MLLLFCTAKSGAHAGSSSSTRQVVCRVLGHIHISTYAFELQQIAEDSVLGHNLRALRPGLLWLPGAHITPRETLLQTLLHIAPGVTVHRRAALGMPALGLIWPVITVGAM